MASAMSQHSSPPASQSLATVLMAVPVLVYGPRSLPVAVPNESEGNGEIGMFRLVLSMELERSGEFRLALRNGSTSTCSSMNIVEYNLRDISYQVKDFTHHELTVVNSPEQHFSFIFEDEKVSQKWWTVLSCSLREVQKAALGSSLASQPSVQPLALKDSVLKLAPEAAKTASSVPTTQLQKLEDLLLRLSHAIESGDQLAASRYAASLAQQQVSVKIQLKESNFSNTAVSVKVGVEDATSSAVISMKVFPYTTIETLKQQVFQDYGFHPTVQRWIIGQCLCVDERTVSSYGIKKDGDMAFLYLLSAKQASLSKLHYEDDQALAMCLPGAAATSTKRDSLVAEENLLYNTLPARLTSKRASKTKEKDGKMGISDIRRFLDLDMLQINDTLPSNGPSRLSQTKPVPSQVVFQQSVEEKRLKNYQYMLQTDSQALVMNWQTTECLICFMEMKPGGGVLLRECLHCFCKECLRQLIKTCDDPEVSCPFRDDIYACSRKMQDREIRALVSPEEYQKFLDRSLMVAESCSPNSYHCKTVDCRGWCIYEDTVNEFRCPICNKLNCLICKAIHQGMNCRQYQDDIQIRALKDSAAQQTAEMLKILVNMGEAMFCPLCKIIIQKKEGCDWIRCTVCHTEICWVTKGSRWGLGGPGDISGGCRCNVNGVKCHPNCQNCH
ncbi:sharpin [Protopterus annectens]|uniref:sharpin n=1 Tax=Protopterus annectens TaxID=7888 RepID=UPI001CFA6685|nr:sharpin [Protopterus annectens]